jgi:hypothetical protein
MKEEDKNWINEFGSGTLKYSLMLGVKCYDMYMHERIAWEYGAGFEAVKASRVSFGAAIAIPDCAPYTETCWFTRRLKHHFKFICSLVYITIADQDGERKGYGIKIDESFMAHWIPDSYVVVAIVAREINGELQDAQNPC